MKRVKSSLSRMRHFRGHGVHSPYIYAIVRDLFMRRELLDKINREVYDSLVKRGVRERVAIEIQNIYSHCGCRSFEIDPEVATSELVIYDKATKYESGKAGTTVVILKPCEERAEEIVSHHHSTTVMRGEYLLIFNNHLPKQHFIL